MFTNDFMLQKGEDVGQKKMRGEGVVEENVFYLISFDSTFEVKADTFVTLSYLTSVFALLVLCYSLIFQRYKIKSPCVDFQDYRTVWEGSMFVPLNTVCLQNTANILELHNS